MSRFVYKDYFPINDPASLKEEKYKDLTETELKRWRNFIKISKSEYIADNLAKKQSDICPACNQKIMKSERVIHHLDYERLCKYSDYNRIFKPTPKQPNRKIRVPRCNECSETKTCIEKLVLLHNNCHFKIHIIEGRIKKPKSKKQAERVLKTDEEKLEYWKKSLNKNHKIIIQECVNMIRKSFPENEFSLKYYTKYIALKPKNSITFKIDSNNTIIRLKKGNLIEIQKLLELRKIETNSYYRKGELHSIAFKINLNQFNNNIEFLKILIKNSIET